MHTKAGYSLSRRNGKNEVVVMREMWGLKHNEKILHTAHRTTTSHAAWERLCGLLDLNDPPKMVHRSTDFVKSKEEKGSVEFKLW